MEKKVCSKCGASNSKSAYYCNACQEAIREEAVIVEEAEYVKSQTNYSYGHLEDPISIGEWVFTLILLSIPFINIIYLIFLLFSSKTSLKNYARASCILIVIMFVIGVLIVI